MKRKHFATTLISLALMTSCAPASTHNHVYGPWVSIDANTHIRTCYTCLEGNEGHVESGSHEFDEGTVTTPATHSKEGVKEYLCLDCGYKKETVIEKTSDHTYNEKIISDAYRASEPTCVDPAKYYYACSCGEKGDETYSYGLPLGHDLTSFSVVNEPTKKTYQALETFDPSGLKVTGICSRGDHVDIDTSELSFTYENGANEFHYGDNKVTLHYYSLSLEISDITVNKATATITPFADKEIVCHGDLNLSSITSDFGEVSFTLTDKDDNEVSQSQYKNLEEDNSPYTLTASLAATNDFDEVKVSHKVNVIHQYSYSPEQGDVCSCGELALTHYYYNLATKQVDSSDIGGGYKDKFDSTCVITDNNTGAAPDYSSLKRGDTLMLKTTLDGQEVHFLAKAVDRIIKSNDDLTSFISAVDADGDEDLHMYAVLGADLKNFYSNSNGLNYFSGTFDGAGHTIDNAQIYGYGVFGRMSSAVLKDITFTDLNTGYLIGWETTNNALIENVAIYIKAGLSSLGGNPSVFAGVFQSHTQLKNVYVDMKDIASTSNTALAGENTKNDFPNSYENVVIRKKAGVPVFTSGDLSPDGITIIDA